MIKSEISASELDHYSVLGSNSTWACRQHQGEEMDTICIETFCRFAGPKCRKCLSEETHDHSALLLMSMEQFIFECQNTIEDKRQQICLFHQHLTKDIKNQQQESIKRLREMEENTIERVQQFFQVMRQNVDIVTEEKQKELMAHTEQQSKIIKNYVEKGNYLGCRDDNTDVREACHFLYTSFTMDKTKLEGKRMVFQKELVNIDYRNLRESLKTKNQQYTVFLEKLSSRIQSYMEHISSLPEKAKTDADEQQQMSKEINKLVFQSSSGNSQTEDASSSLLAKRKNPHDQLIENSCKSNSNSNTNNSKRVCLEDISNNIKPKDKPKTYQEKQIQAEINYIVKPKNNDHLQQGFDFKDYFFIKRLDGNQENTFEIKQNDVLTMVFRVQQHIILTGFSLYKIIEGAKLATFDICIYMNKSPDTDPKAFQSIHNQTHDVTQMQSNPGSFISQNVGLKQFIYIPSDVEICIQLMSLESQSFRVIKGNGMDYNYPFQFYPTDDQIKTNFDCFEMGQIPELYYQSPYNYGY